MKTPIESWVLFAAIVVPYLAWLINSETPAPTPTSSKTKPGCVDTCGDVSVPYPFGIGDSACALNPGFLLTCNYSFNPPQLLITGHHSPVVNISIENGTIVHKMPMAYRCFNATGDSQIPVKVLANFSDSPFTFSDTGNMLTVVGCSTVGLVMDSGGAYGSGCMSYCNQTVKTHDLKSCTGIGCCQTYLPQQIKTLNVSIGRIVDESTDWEFNPCKFAFISDNATFNISTLQLPDNPSLEDDSRHNAVLEWVVEDKTCDEALGSASDFACKGNANCSYSVNGQGYRCACLAGFIGNPYLEDCKDIDECKDPEKYPCYGTCKNTYGNYTCKCPLGMHGDGKIACHGIQVITFASVVGAIIFMIIIVLLVVIILKKRRKEKNFLENGGMLLKHQRVRIFSEAELTQATRNYNPDKFLGEGGFGSVYKGVLADNTEVAVKRPKESKGQLNQEFLHEIGIVSQVNHKNVVKLLGLCLETNVPLLVYEFISNGTLYEHIHYKKSRLLSSWRNRLRIAAEAAHALDYLHSIADPPIIHGDVKSSNILLDDNYTVKISDFGGSVLISPGETEMATKIRGTFGYLDPEYLLTGELTTQSDVYSFGIVLVELLTGLKPNFGLRTGEKGSIIHNFMSALENNNLSQIICFNVIIEDEIEEIEAFAELAKRCINSNNKKRPTMKEVAEELARLTKLNRSLWPANNFEESERLLGQRHLYSPDSSTGNMSKLDTVSISYSFAVEYHSDSI